MARNNLAAAVVGTVGNVGAWIAHTEQVWMPTMGAYVRFLAPELGLPDLRGPFLMMTMIYIGLRLGDLWNQGEKELEESL